MRITKYTHACVRLEDDGRVLVIDPANWTEAEAWAGADAVLVTHEHADHVDVHRLAGLGVRPSRREHSAADVSHVDAGAEFIAAGFRVRAVGGRHVYLRRPT